MGVGAYQKYPFLTVYENKLYWVTVYEPVGGEISGARIAAILLIGAESSNSGEITMLKFDKLEKNLPGVNKILRFARAEVQNFEGWIPQQVQIYQDEDNNLYAISSIVSGSGSGQRIMALAGVDLLGEEERAYVVKTTDYGNLNEAHSALIARMFGGEIGSGAQGLGSTGTQKEEPTAKSQEPTTSTEERLDEIDSKLEKIMEKLEIE